GVRYASQQVSAKGRKYLKSQRLRRFLGEYPNSTTIHKPLFMHRKTYGALLTRLRHVEAKPDSRKYKGKRLTERTLKPNNMYQVEAASLPDAKAIKQTPASRGDRGGVSALDTRRSSLPSFPPSEPRQLAEQARNRDHDSRDPYNQTRKQQKIAQERRHIAPPL